MVATISGNREKVTAALTSLIAAVGLTSFKLIVGLMTGSLGILAEAAHSGLDLVAAAMTLIAVRFADRPADREHLYGHGRAENLSALFETLLLIATCVWIVWEAVHRLSSHRAAVEVNVWSLAVMLTSIAVDYSRSGVLSRAAQKHHSQALEADALHFQTDIWSSLVVIVGLAAVKAGEWIPGAAWLRNGDSVAALGVSGVVVWVSVKLGRRAVDALLDAAPAGMEERIARITEAVPGVCNCHRVRVRASGPVLFVDLHILVDGHQTLEEAHELTERIEAAIHGLAPEADVTVHPEPV